MRPATAADFAFIRALAGHPDNAPFVTDEDEAGLAAYLPDPSARLLIWQEQGTPAGYALFCGVAALPARSNCAALRWPSPATGAARGSCGI
ncbi:hypothetical protein MASR1M32_30170 [Rhodobacter sp.]